MVLEMIAMACLSVRREGGFGTNEFTYALLQIAFYICEKC